MLRTHTCGELGAKDIKKKVDLCGWCQSPRDHGGVIFIDLRDRYGLTQVLCNPDRPFFKDFEALRREDVIRVSGTVRARPEGMKNSNLMTGEIEVVVDELEILNKSQTPPIEVDDRVEANEDLRLAYRYIDLRRPKMQNFIMLRHKAAQSARKFLSENSFIEIETPLPGLGSSL